jgi:hypothetical protein
MVRFRKLYRPICPREREKIVDTITAEIQSVNSLCERGLKHTNDVYSECSYGQLINPYPANVEYRVSS